MTANPPPPHPPVDPHWLWERETRPSAATIFAAPKSTPAQRATALWSELLSDADTSLALAHADSMRRVAQLGTLLWEQDDAHERARLGAWMGHWTMRWGFQCATVSHASVGMVTAIALPALLGAAAPHESPLVVHPTPTRAVEALAALVDGCAAGLDHLPVGRWAPSSLIARVLPWIATALVDAPLVAGGHLAPTTVPRLQRLWDTLDRNVEQWYAVGVVPGSDDPAVHVIARRFEAARSVLERAALVGETTPKPPPSRRL